MIKLITPPGMLLTVALLVIYSVYAFMIGSIEDSYPLLIGGLVAVIATYGAAMVRPWSQYLIYALTAGFVAKLGISIYDGFVSGYFEIQYRSNAQIARVLLPSLLMTLLSAFCCTLVYRQFRLSESAKAREELTSG